MTVVDPFNSSVVKDAEMVQKTNELWQLRPLNTYEANWSYPLTTPLGNYTVQISVIDNNGYYRNQETGSPNPFVEYETKWFTIGNLVYYDPALPPDGLAIAFGTDRDGCGFCTWLITRDSVGGRWNTEAPLAGGVRPDDWAPDGSGFLSGPGMDLISRNGRVVWHRNLAAIYGLRLTGFVRFSRDGKTIFLAAKHRDGQQGICAIPASDTGEARLVVAFDDPGLATTMWEAPSVGANRLYLTVSEYDSDIWVAKLNY